ncbi:MAG: PhzF family phenazine biosynthesis protein [Parasphingorhabdus sp.]|nr:PhzF family phenazine biosynthesis protein [Parasphingorhabdus sp.]
MTELPYFHVDAFANRPFSGNQAAIMPLESWLADDVMQAIAEENAFAETAFTVVFQGDEADYELRWFTPALEVALCGHATLAAGHILLGERDAVRFLTRKAGILEVRREGEGYSLTLPAYPPTAKAMPEITAMVGGDPTATLFRDGGYNVLRYSNAREVLDLAPDYPALAKLGDQQFIATAPGIDTDVLSRVFVPGAAINEDSVTGAAHAVLTPYWAAELGRPAFSASQASARGGLLHCRLDGDKARLGGQCVTVVEGKFHL